MSSPVVTKQCRFCYSEIDCRAKKCPYCHTPQGIWLAFIPVLIVLLVALLVWAMMAGRHEALECTKDIAIPESTMYLGPCSQCQADGCIVNCPSVVGRLQNTGTHVLDSVSLEIQVFNKQGKLVDVFGGYLSGSYQPNSTHAFKIMGDPIHLPDTEYATHEVTVTSADSYE